MGALDSHTSARVREISRLMFVEDDSGNIVALKGTATGVFRMLSNWTIKGSERIINSAGHEHATIPAGTLMALVTAEGGAIHWLHNGDAALTSPGFVPENSTLPIFFGGITGLTFYGAVGSFVYIVYYG